MSQTSVRELAINGLWHNNPALVQLLGLCPLLAVTGSVVNALGLGLATLSVLVGANVAVSLIRHHVPTSVRLPAFVMIIASFVTCAELLMQAYTYSLYQILGIFIPLIVTNCAILGRADAFASRQPVSAAAVDGIMMGLGFLAVLLVLGAIREVLGQGTLFSGMALLFGEYAKHWQINVFADWHLLIMILPPGAFFTMSVLIALKNIIDQQLKKRQAAVSSTVHAQPSRRVRVTD